MLVNVAEASKGLTGFIAQKCLEQCGIVVDRMLLPYDDKPGQISGIRLGTPIVTKNGMGAEEMDRIAGMLDAVLKKIRVLDENRYTIDESTSTNIQNAARELARRFPIWQPPA